MKVCVLGDTGLLGQALVRYAEKNSGPNVLGISTSPFKGEGSRDSGEMYQHELGDILEEKEEVFDRILKFEPELLINCIALVDLQACEKNQTLARQLNVEVAGTLSAFCCKSEIDFVHISSDQVFSGEQKIPYTEQDTTNPVNFYGQSKLLAESLILDTNPKALVVRTNFVGFRDVPGRPTFAEWLFQALMTGEKIMLFEDYVTSSIHVDFLSQLIFEAHQMRVRGLWHLASHDAVSKYRFGEMLARESELDFSHVSKGRLKGSGLKPDRPPYLALDVSRAERRFGAVFSDVLDTIKKLCSDHRLRVKAAHHA